MKDPPPEHRLVDRAGYAAAMGMVSCLFAWYYWWQGLDTSVALCGAFLPMLVAFLLSGERRE